MVMNCYILILAGGDQQGVMDDLLESLKKGNEPRSSKLKFEKRTSLIKFASTAEAMLQELEK